MAKEENVDPPSWFNTAFGFGNIQGRAKQLQAATINIPDCGICLEKVSDPIALKCGHIFDKHCIKKCLASGLSKCPYDRKDVKETEFIEQHDMYESTKCSIKAAVFPSVESAFTGSALISTDISVFSTREKIQEKVISQYLKDSGQTEVPFVKAMAVKGSYTFYPGKTLADYEILPGEETTMWILLA